MNNFFQENRRNALILLGLLFLLLIVVYVLFYQPLSKELKSAENQVAQTKSDIELLNAQIKDAGGESIQVDDLDRIRYESQLPMSPETEELILILEEIEFVSESRIESISFSYNSSIPNPEQVETDEEDIDSEESRDNLDSNEEQSESEIAPVIDIEEMPEKLQVITLNLSVSSPNYEQFQTFIGEIEKQERMMMVSNMNFQNPGEETLFEEDPDDSIYSSLSVTTFYYGE